MTVPCLTEFQCAVYADGELQAVEDRLAAEHLELCESCRDMVAALRVESMVLVQTIQATDFIEFELEDDALKAPQAENLSIARFAAFVLAMSVLLRPVLNAFEELRLPVIVSWLAITVAYIVPATVGFANSIAANAGWIAFGAIVLLGLLLFSRRSMVTSSVLSVLALLTVFSSSSYAYDIRRGGKPVNVPAGETIDDTLVVAGESVTVEGTITGDLIAFVRQATVRGTVKGNVIVFAQQIELEGTIGGSAIGFGQTVQTRGQVAHNIYAFGQTADIGRNAQVDQNATLLAAGSDIEGTIGKDVFVGAGSLTVAEGARIGGGLTARVGDRQNVRIAPGAVIGRTDIEIPPPQPSRYLTVSFYVWQTIWLAAAFLTGLVLFRLAPALLNIRLVSGSEVLLSAGVGLLVLFGLPVAAVVAAVTLIGLPLGLIGFACWLVACYLAKVVVAGFLGRSLLAKGGDSQPAIALVLLAGLALVFIAINLPFIGPLINFLLVMLGLGALGIKISQLPRWRPAEAA